MSRGPYKQYEHDPDIRVPRRTYYRQKRKHAEREDTESTIQFEANRYEVDSSNMVCSLRSRRLKGGGEAKVRKIKEKRRGNEGRERLL